MGTNFYTALIDGTDKFKAASLNPPHAALDKALIYNMRNIAIHCDGEITYTKGTTGVLAWSDVLRIHFTRDDGTINQNTVNAGSVNLTDGQFAYIDLSETDNAVISVAAATMPAVDAASTLGIGSSYKRLVLGYKNSASDRFYPVALKTKIGFDSFRTFTAQDATPSVKGTSNFKTANANPTTITMFDDGIDGQVIRVVINDADTTIDFSGTHLKGNAGVDWTPASGDWMECVFDGTDWFCSVHDTTA